LKSFTKLITGFALALAFLTQAAVAEVVNLTLVLTNDMYRMSPAKDRGGFAKLATIVKAERAKGGNVIFAHAGDAISPSLMSGFDQGAHMIELINAVEPDIFVPGNHEYDFGADIFAKRMGEAKFPIFAANLRGADGQPLPGILDSRIMEFGPAKVGFIGLTAEDSPVKSSPAPLQIAPTVETGVAQARALREAGADVVVAIVHASRSVDQDLFRSGAFDIILTGDDHDLAVFFDGRTAMVESYNEADFVTAVDVAIDVTENGGRRRVSWFPSFRIMDTAPVAEDADVAAIVARYEDLLSKELDITVGTSTTPLDSRKASVRGGETAIGNLIADAMKAAVGADIAITNGGGIRGNKEYPAGSSLTRRDILTELPFGNLNLLLEIKGSDVLAALENGVSDVEGGAGRFPQISGMTVDVDLSKPKGSRVEKVMVGDKPLDPGATYKLSTNDFMARGGDGYTSFRNAKVVLGEMDGKLMANDVMAYVRKMGSVSPKVEGRLGAM
jgi:2',3'-cyclic-nucleotide 2'-phosphodiesterase (5'-nucleotidase family)